MKLRQFGSKVGIERHIVEILIRHFWLVSVLEMREVLRREVHAVIFPEGSQKPGH